MCRRPLILVGVAALAAGCGGGSPSGVANVARTRQNATTTTQKGTLASAFAFARCMRSHGIAGWPDPDATGGFDKSKLRQLGLSVSRVRALEEGACNIPLPSPGQPQATVTRADQADYLRAAACMRSHGFPDFPDPTFPNNTVRTNVPPSINQDTPRFKSAAAICTKLIPAGLPYSSRSAS